jgi:hypothetical protein
MAVVIGVRVVHALDASNVYTVFHAMPLPLGIPPNTYGRVLSVIIGNWLKATGNGGMVAAGAHLLREVL